MNDNKREERCEICNISLSAANAVHHFDGKKHKKKLEEAQKQAGVFITGLPEGKKKEDILQYFSQFGSIKKTRVGPTLKYMIIQYEHIYEAEKVMNTQHIIDGKTLILQRQNISAQPPKEGHHEVEMLRQIQNLPTLDMQIRQFINCLTPDLNYMVGIYHQVKYDMAEAMHIVFPSPMVYPFGSATTSLQFKTSDLDIYVDIDNDEDCLHKARKGLFKSNRFENIFVLSSAKIPIIRCVHRETRIKCDVNFKSMLGVKNSELIRYFININRNVRPFILVIKYWAKSHEISGTNHLFTNYSLVMMCIFFLQQKYSFPSVWLLQQGTHPTNAKIIWNMNLSEQVMYTRRYDLHASLLSLLREFFEFYANFDYESNIICPFLGKPIEKTLFLSEDTIPKEFRLYRQICRSSIGPLKCDTPICLQDPFEHNLNTCRIIFPNILSRFVTMCEVAQSVLMKENENNMLHELFTKTEEGFSNNYPHICIRPHGTISGEKGNSDMDIGKLWFEQARQFFNIVFENIFKFNMTAEVNAKAQKINEQDVHQQEQSVNYRAVCSMDLWTRRDLVSSRIKDKLDKCENILGKETLISDSMWAAATTKTRILFEYLIVISFHKKPIRANVNFTPIQKNGYSEKRNFHSFYTYCNSTLDSWFEKYEQEIDKTPEIL